MFQKSDQNKRVRCYITLFWFVRLIVPLGEFAFPKLMHVRLPLFGFPTLPRHSRTTALPAFLQGTRPRSTQRNVQEAVTSASPLTLHFGKAIAVRLSIAQVRQYALNIRTRIWYLFFCFNERSNFFPKLL